MVRIPSILRTWRSFRIASPSISLFDARTTTYNAIKQQTRVIPRSTCHRSANHATKEFARNPRWTPTAQSLAHHVVYPAHDPLLPIKVTSTTPSLTYNGLIHHKRTIRREFWNTVAFLATAGIALVTVICLAIIIVKRVCSVRYEI